MTLTLVCVQSHVVRYPDCIVANVPESLWVTSFAAVIMHPSSYPCRPRGPGYEAKCIHEVASLTGCLDFLLLFVSQELLVSHLRS